MIGFLYEYFWVVSDRTNAVKILNIEVGISQTQTSFISCKPHKVRPLDLPKTLHLLEWVKLASCLDISVLLAQ